MKNLKKQLKKIIAFIFDNYIVSIFIAIVIFVGIISVIKLMSSDRREVYVEVKISQGLWWVNTAKPSIWIVNSIQKGNVKKDILGKPVIEIMEVRYYPWRDTDVYDMYVKLKVMAEYNKKEDKYSFNRSTLASGAPIDLDFSHFQISGTVTQVSTKPFKNDLIEKTITLSKVAVLQSEYENLVVGDFYFDGTDKVFEITNVEAIDTYVFYSPFGNNYPVESEPPKNVVIQAKVKVKEINSTNIFAIEKVVRMGKRLDVSTATLNLENYLVIDIE